MVEQNLISFEGKNVRKIWHNDEWYFSVVDIIEVLTDSHSPRAYWTKFKQHTAHLSENYVKLKLQASDGKHFVSDCANTEGVFRIIMSIPSPKARTQESFEYFGRPSRLTPPLADLVSPVASIGIFPVA